MCGIFALKTKKDNAGDVILEGLKSLEYRGYDSWGVALKKEDGKLFVEKHVGKIGQATLPKITSSIGIGHTRWATHGGVTEKNAHPHTDCKGKIAVVHNGIVENFEDLKKTLTKKHAFVSVTDTEVVAHLIEEKIEKGMKPLEAVRDTFKSLEGLNAIIVFFLDSNEFIAVKSGSPLVFGNDDKTSSMILASDAVAIAPHTKKVYFMEDEELLCVGEDRYTLYNLNLKEKKANFTTLSYESQDLGLGKYPHYMIKEIHEQPQILTNLANNDEPIQKLAGLIKHAFGTYLIGCGTAFYAGFAGTYLFSKIAKTHINASVGSEFSYLVDFLQKKSLVIALSQSGETIDIISSAKALKQKGASLFAITNVLGSTLYRMADYKMLLGAGPEKCVVSTKAFTAKIAILFLAAHNLAESYDKGKSDLKQAISEVESILKQTDAIKKLASYVTNKEHVFVLGRGSSYPLALESALKIKEVSYIHAEGFAAGELKHGVIALIEKGTPVIVYNPEDETYEDTLSSAYEVKARGAYLIGVSSKKNDVYDEFIEVKNCGEATLIPNVVIAQLLGYYLALEKGLDPDKPRNLAKSVTVK